MEMFIEWKPVALNGFENRYEVSTTGLVRSLSKAHYHKLLHPVKRNNGYLFYNLKIGRKIQKMMTAHRLVALTFIENPNNLPQIDHINCNKLDNRVENLKWVTAKENMNNSRTILRLRSSAQRIKGTEQYKKNRIIASKKSTLVTAHSIVCIETGVWYMSILEATRVFNVSDMTIYESCCKYKRGYKKALRTEYKGKPVYHFRFATEEENAINVPIYRDKLLKELGDL